MPILGEEQGPAIHLDFPTVYYIYNILGFIFVGLYFAAAVFNGRVIEGLSLLTIGIIFFMLAKSKKNHARNNPSFLNRVPFTICKGTFHPALRDQPPVTIEISLQWPPPFHSPANINRFEAEVAATLNDVFNSFSLRLRAPETEPTHIKHPDDVYMILTRQFIEQQLGAPMHFLQTSLRLPVLKYDCVNIIIPKPPPPPSQSPPDSIYV